MRILKEDCVGLVIDIQEKLFPHMDQHELLFNNTHILVKGLNLLNIPLIVTEQYPRGLGGTMEGLSHIIPGFDPVEKMSFSCCDEASVMEKLSVLSKKNVIICGIEAHVCVLQTVIDLIENDYQPVLIANCTSSRNPDDLLIAIERMRQEGAIISSYESILFELARVSGTESFKMISKLVK